MLPLNTILKAPSGKVNYTQSFQVYTCDNFVFDFANLAKPNYIADFIRYLELVPEKEVPCLPSDYYFSLEPNRSFQHAMWNGFLNIRYFIINCIEAFLSRPINIQVFSPRNYGLEYVGVATMFTIGQFYVENFPSFHNLRFENEGLNSIKLPFLKELFEIPRNDRVNDSLVLPLCCWQNMNYIQGLRLDNYLYSWGYGIALSSNTKDKLDSHVDKEGTKVFIRYEFKDSIKLDLENIFMYTGNAFWKMKSKLKKLDFSNKANNATPPVDLDLELKNFFQDLKLIIEGKITLADQLKKLKEVRV